MCMPTGDGDGGAKAACRNCCSALRAVDVMFMLLLPVSDGARFGVDPVIRFRAVLVPDGNLLNC